MGGIEFCEEDCICDHLDYEHDDGFGCTVTDCPCIAQWRLTDDPPDYEYEDPYAEEHAEAAAELAAIEAEEARDG